MTFRDYIATIEHSNSDSFVEQDKYKELNYLKSHTFRFKQYFKLVPDTKKSLIILDIGTTPFTFFLKKKYPHYKIFSLDKTSFLAERCRLNDVEHIQGDLDVMKIPSEDNSFDVVLMTEVLEHIFAPHTEVIRELHRVLKPGGILILSVPNLVKLIQRIKILFGKQIFEDPDKALQKNSVHGYGHLHEYTMKELENSLSRFFPDLKVFTIQPNVNDVFYSGSGNIIKKILLSLYYTICIPFKTFKPNILAVGKK